MASAYSTIASGGVYHKPIAITKIKQYDGEVLKGDDLPKRLQPFSERRFEEGVTYEATSILEQNVYSGGTGARRADGLPRGGQDRHDRQQLRRLVRGLHPGPGHRRLGRLSGRADLHDLRVLRSPVDGGTLPRRDLGRLHGRGDGRLLRGLPGAGDARDLHEVLRHVLVRAAARAATTTSTRPRTRRRTTTTTEEDTTTTDPGTTTTDPGTTTETPEDTGAGTGGVDPYDPSLYESPPQDSPG